MLLFSFGVTAYCQTTITGEIALLTGEKVSGATILIKEGSKIISYTISDDKGNYAVVISKNGEYTIEVNFIGFSKEVSTFEINNNNKEGTIIKNFSLIESHNELKEVVIEYEQPVFLRGDTLVYDAKALGTGKEVVVEDLLKNIPGVVIGNDGTITYNDQPIEKIMVDGDDLFNKGYSLLTKSMPVKPLDKVEVLQNYSNNKLLKGVEDSKKVALNLTVSEEYKNIWFGDVFAGYGNENRFLFSGNLMNFNKKFKSYFTTSLNNAGYDKVGATDKMIYNSSEIESIGFGTKALKVMSVSSGFSGLNENRTRFNNAKMATLSTIFTLSSKIKLKLIGLSSFDKLYAYRELYSVTNVNSVYFENSERNNALTKFNKNYVSAFLTYDVADSKLFQLASSYSFGSNNYNDDLVFNGVTTQERLEINNTFIDEKMTYTYKWNERNVVLFKGRFFTDKLPQNYSIDDYLMGDLFPYNDINSIGNNVKSSKEYLGLATEFLFRKKNNDLIRFTVGYNQDRDDLQAVFKLFAQSGFVEPEGYQAKSGYDVSDLYAKGGYKFDFNKFTLGVNAEVHQLFNNFRNSVSEAKSQSVFYINPIINAAWKISYNSGLSLNYIYSTTNSNLLQVNDSYLLKSSRSFSKGLGDFNQLDNYAASIVFSTKHYLNRHGLTVGFDYSKQNNVISYRSQLEQNSSLSEAFIMRGGDRFGGRVSVYKIIKPLKGTASIDIGANRLLYYNEVNNSGLRTNVLYSQNYKFGWRSDFNGFFNFDFESQWTFSKVKSDYTFNSSYGFSDLNLNFLIKENFNILAKNEYYYYGGESSNNNYFFTDLEGRYSFFDDKYTIGLSARNLFNTKTFTTYNVSDIGYSTNSYRILPRYIMATFKFRF